MSPVQVLPECVDDGLGRCSPPEHGHHYVVGSALLTDRARKLVEIVRTARAS